MSIIRGNVLYAFNNTLTPTIGIPGVPVVLRDTIALYGAVALTDTNGAFVFENVPDGSYQLIEAWGTTGGVASPVNYPGDLIAMPTMPMEAEPPLSALPVPPPALADMLMAISPNLLNLVVNGDLMDQNFYDAPVGSKPVVFNGLQMVGANLVDVADNGTFGTVPAGSAVNTIPPTAPYPGVTPGLPYQAAPEITDGHYSIVNIRRAVDTAFSWWNLSDHETMLETGRFMFVNGDTPGAILFSDTFFVSPDTYYTFTGWGLNLLNMDGMPPRFSIRVMGSDGRILGYQLFNSLDFTPIPVWYQGGFLFNSENYSTVTIEVISEAPFSLIGNDYAIDELMVYETEIIDLLAVEKTMSPSVIYSNVSGAGQDITVSVTVRNSSDVVAPDVVFQDVIDARFQFVSGSVTVNGIPRSTVDPTSGFQLGDMLPGAVNIVVFHVTTVTEESAVIPNTAMVSYDAATNGNGDVIRNTIDSNTATVELIVNRAMLEMVKTADKAFADVNDVIAYTITLRNTGNVSANNVVITDEIPPGTTFVAGSLTGAFGTLPTLYLGQPLLAGNSVVIRYQVRINGSVPDPDPILNTASAVFTYTLNPANPDGITGFATSNTTSTKVNTALLIVRKQADRQIAYIGDSITYQIAVQNKGNVPADTVVLTDLLPAGVAYVANSLQVSMPYTGTISALTLTDAIAAGTIVTISFRVKVTALPNPNPIENVVNVGYTYTVDPGAPEVIVNTKSNVVSIIVFRYRFAQQIDDLSESVALQQAALAAIVHAEGAKIQKLAGMHNMNPDELLCLNKSVADMLQSITMLEAILRSKLRIVSCQINGECGS